MTSGEIVGKNPSKDINVKLSSFYFLELVMIMCNDHLRDIDSKSSMEFTAQLLTHSRDKMWNLHKRSSQDINA